MAKLTETDEFTEEVYQLEVTDFVEGGENGVDNKPHKALANRTRWLKSKIDAFLAGTGLTKSMVGLANVDNTSDLNKPLSTATQTALNNKEPTITILPIAKGGTGRDTDGELAFMSQVPHLASYYWIKTEFYFDRTSSKHQLATQYISSGFSKKFQRSQYNLVWTPWVEILTANSDVGLANVDNTSDLNKPLSTAAQTALNNKEPTITILPIAKGGTGRDTDGELAFMSQELPSTTTKNRYLFDTNSGANMDNIPHLASYYWIKTEFYFDRTSSKHQLATQYISSGFSKKFQRSQYNLVWTPWVEILTANSTTQVLTSAAGYRIEPPDSSGKRLITQWGKVTTNTENYAVIFPIALTAVPSNVKINFEEPTYSSSFAPSYFATNSRTSTGFKITRNGSAILGGAILWEAKGY